MKINYRVNTSKCLANKYAWCYRYIHHKAAFLVTCMFPFFHQARLSSWVELSFDSCDESGSFNCVNMIFAELTLSQLITLGEAIKAWLEFSSLGLWMRRRKRRDKKYRVEKNCYVCKRKPNNNLGKQLSRYSQISDPDKTKCRLARLLRHPSAGRCEWPR